MSDDLGRCGGTGMVAYWDGSAYAGEFCRGCADCEHDEAGGEMNGIDLIATERQRQISDERWTPTHDDIHVDAELAIAACCYANLARRQADGSEPPMGAPNAWPWDYSWWKPTTEPIRNLVKAGALIAAEIDRLQRAARPPEEPAP